MVYCSMRASCMGHGKIVRVRVESKCLAAVGHCGATGILEVEFQGGEVHRYFAVPRSVFEGLVRADSKGVYFHRFVRERYPSIRAEAGAGVGSAR